MWVATVKGGVLIETVICNIHLVILFLLNTGHWSLLEES